MKRTVGALSFSLCIPSNPLQEDLNPPQIDLDPKILSYLDGETEFIEKLGFLVAYAMKCFLFSAKMFLLKCFLHSEIRLTGIRAPL